MVIDTEVEEAIDFALFEEPDDFRPPSPEPSVTTFDRKPENVQFGLRTLVVHLPPKHSLWAHWLWNAGQSMTHYLDSHKELYQNKNVLELGAAASLPSIICSINNAKYVVSTDFPDLPILHNITKNAEESIPEKLNKSFFVKGYIWGDKEEHLDEPLTKNGKFDLLLLADLIFNHNQHQQLLSSCKQLLSDNGVILITYSHHNPKWIDRDMKFFELSEQYGFEFKKEYEERWKPMFVNDVGDEVVRATVYCYKMWKKLPL
ncbi:hypothetical protein BC833DRAFT_576487 [Globomyces pollinis-pini]|nr:hypothetical protein BC833DRAFT_576487 [Globomyces pollinis-pini]KAJ2998626.1 nicotinamide n-methyltransferase [Globomyces sp. JEL0801]